MYDCSARVAHEEALSPQIIPLNALPPRRTLGGRQKPTAEFSRQCPRIVQCYDVATGRQGLQRPQASRFAHTEEAIT